MERFTATAPHRRWNPLERSWVLVSPHRTKRPWQGQVERTVQRPDVVYDPECYLCPGNSRAGGHLNPAYDQTFIFDNDFAALMPGVDKERLNQRDLLIAETQTGICRVVCFSPEHHLTVARMTPPAVRSVVDVWAAQYEELEANDSIGYVQVFENRGEMMGASNPHPHCQIWATESLPNQAATEFAAQLDYRVHHPGGCLLCDYLDVELKARERIVVENAHFAVVVPYWAVWPFETMVLAKRHVARLQDLDNAERDSLAAILREITIRYDNLFEVSFPYSMGFHAPPADGDEHPEWHFHAHYHPPLLRSATVRKFMVGFELLATPQRDITPELAAERLRGLSAIHYRQLA